jgi:hypothetical protein
MKSFRDYLAEAEYVVDTPVAGDDFAINIREECLLETYICEEAADGVVLYADEKLLAILESYGLLETEFHETVILEGQMKELMWRDAERMTLDQFVDKYGDEDWIREFWNNIMGDIDEAKYQGREVPLGKPMKGDVKKSKVYVKGPNGNVVKVNFGHGGTSAKRAGQKTMKIKKSNPARRKSFRARHNCDNPGPRHKARYWSCRAW